MKEADMSMEIGALANVRGAEDVRISVAAEFDPSAYELAADERAQGFGASIADSTSGNQATVNPKTRLCSAGELRAMRAALIKSQEVDAALIDRVLPVSSDRPAERAETPVEDAAYMLAQIDGVRSALNDTPASVLVNEACNEAVHVDSADNREPFVTTPDGSIGAFLSSDGVSVLSSGNIVLRSRYVFQEVLPCGERAIWIDHDTGLSVFAPVIATVPNEEGVDAPPQVVARLRAETRVVPETFWAPVVSRLESCLRSSVELAGPIQWSIGSR